MSNFAFFETKFQTLASLGGRAERYVYDDPNSSIYNLGQLAERIVLSMCELESLTLPTFDDTQANRIKLLKREGLLPSRIDQILYTIRKKRNDVVHGATPTETLALQLLELGYHLSVWFYDVYGEWNFAAEPYQVPARKTSYEHLEETLATQKTQEKEQADLIASYRKSSPS